MDTEKLKFDNEMESMLITNDFDAIEIPEDADIKLVIRLLNDLGISFNAPNEKRSKFWKQYLVKKKKEDLYDGSGVSATLTSVPSEPSVYPR